MSESSKKQLKKGLASQIKKLKIGNTGSIFVLNSKGEYILEPENENLPEEKLVKIISKTKAASKDETI